MKREQDQESSTWEGKEGQRRGAVGAEGVTVAVARKLGERDL